jgi:glycosyltransferase involved in cell wall biosynthesis
MHEPIPQDAGKGPPADPRKLRVAIFSDSLPERNGAGAYYTDLAAQLDSEVEAIELFQPVLKKRAWNFALPLPGDATQKLLTPNVFRLRRQFRQLRPHLVVAVTPGPFGLLGMYFARRSKAGFITAFHTHFEGLVQMYGNSLFFRIAFKYLEFVNRILCKGAQTVLINNAELTETVRGLGGRRVDIMGTPLSRAFLEPPMVAPSGGLEQVVFAGRLAPEKNLPAVMEAAKALPDIRFVFAGDGPLRKQLEAQAQQLPNVRLTGWLDREALRQVVDQSSLLLLPSHMETFGTVALEAMARGRPALVAANAGIHSWEVLSPALFVLAKDQPIAAALRELRELPASVWQEKAAAARHAAESLNRDTIQQWAGFVAAYGKEPLSK